MKKFAVFDIDGTVFRWQLYYDVVFELIDRGHIPISAKEEINEKMLLWRSRAHSQAYRDLEKTIVIAFRSYLGGIKTSALEAAADTVLERGGKEVHTYTRDLIEKLRSDGYILVALSASQDEVVQRFAKMWQFDIALGQAHDIVDGVYVGPVPVEDEVHKRKGELLKQIVKDHKLSWKDSVAVGDSHSDAQMLELVENPIAFNPDSHLFQDAKEHGWPIVIERKNMIYRLEPHGSSYILA
jgi:HAD superfamily hydrolase (TIGR01490 family)